MFKIATVFALALLAACDAATPAPTAQSIAAPLAAATVPSRMSCGLGEKCETAAECVDGLVCQEGACVAPCEIAEHCAPGAFQPTGCYGGVCKFASGALACPALCEAGSSCVGDADCPVTAPTCDGKTGEKGQCVAPCETAKDCFGDEMVCSSGVCRFPTGLLGCN